METVLQWGLDFIRQVQYFAVPSLTVIMRIITWFGGITMYLILLTLVYWCIDEKKGFRLGVMFLLSFWINISLKFLFNQPRPFFEGYDPSVGIISERLAGLPSGHAQISLVIFFIIASWINKKWAYACAIFLSLLIGFSRIYLGVHFPTDVAAGWILGAVILCGYFFSREKIEALLVKGGFRACMIASAVVSFLMILYLPGGEECLLSGGIMLGFGAGYCLNRHYIGFSCDAQPERKGASKYLALSVRFLLGVTALMLIFIAAGKILPQDGANKNLFVYIRFALGGIWITAAAPWVFVKLRLAGTRLINNNAR